jgi:hypothetical protein
LQRNSRCSHWQVNWHWPSSGILKDLCLRPVRNMEPAGTSAVYCEMLQRGLKPAVRLSEGVLLLHDSAHPHAMHHTFQTCWKLNWKSWSIQPTVWIWCLQIFTFFGLLKRTLRGDFSVKRLYRAWCISGYMYNQRFSFMLSRTL